MTAGPDVTRATGERPLQPGLLPCRWRALMGGQQGLTPLQPRLAGVGRMLAIAAVVLCVVVLVTGLALGQGIELMVITAISLVVAAVPESLPAVVTLALRTSQELRANGEPARLRVQCPVQAPG
jgi:hypothetical protein